jgi:hydroxymethylglutaryl-CoA lyase
LINIAHVEIVEEGPREGFQFERGPIETAGKIKLINALAATGLKRIQAVSFVDPTRVPGMADAAAVAAGIVPRPGIEFDALWYNRRGLDQALAAAKFTLSGRVSLYASNEFLRRNLGRTPDQHRRSVKEMIALCKERGIPVPNGSVTAAFGCNFEGDVAPTKVLDLVTEILAIAAEENLKIERLMLADTMAWATPVSIKRVVGQIRDRYPDLRIGLHLHDTRGLALANAYAGLEMGVDHFDASVAGLGGCPFANHNGAAGNVCTEDLVFLCQELGIATGIDLDALIECAYLAESVVGHPLPGSIMRGGPLNNLRTKVAASAKKASHVS